MSTLLKKDKGFTLIEIVLVLAIAGLILLIVFLAVQGAQKSRRDSARKHDAARMLAAWESCAANNGGNYNSAACNTTTVLMAGGSAYFSPNVSPSGGAYGTAAPSAATPDNMQSTYSAAGTAACGGTNHYAVITVGQEQGTGTYCVGN